MLIKIILPVKNACLIALNHIRQCIVDDMHDSHNPAFKLKGQKTLGQFCQITFFLTGCHQMYQHLSGCLGTTHQKVTEITGMFHFLIIRHRMLGEIIQHGF